MSVSSDNVALNLRTGAELADLNNLKTLAKRKQEWHTLLFGIVVIVLIELLVNMYRVHQKFGYVIAKIDNYNTFCTQRATGQSKGQVYQPLCSGMRAAMCMEWPKLNHRINALTPTLLPAIFAAYSSPYLAACMGAPVNNKQTLATTDTEAQYIQQIIGACVMNSGSGEPYGVKRILCEVFTQKDCSKGTCTAGSTGLPLDVCYDPCPAPPYLPDKRANSAEEASSASQQAITFAMLGNYFGPYGAALGAIAGALLGLFTSRSKLRAEDERQQKQCEQNRQNCYWPEGSTTCANTAGSGANANVVSCNCLEECKQQNGYVKNGTCYQQDKTQTTCSS